MDEAQIPPQDDNQSINHSKKVSIPVWAAVVIVVAVLFAGAAAGYWYWVKSAQPQPQDQNQSAKTPDGQKTTDGASATTTSSTAEATTTAESCKTYTSTTRQLSGEIAWSKPQAIPAPDIFAPPNDSNTSGYTAQNSKFFKVGEVKSGSYQGFDVLLGDIAFEGPAFYSTYYRYLKKDNQIVLLAVDSDNYSGNPDDQIFDHKKLKIDNTYRISDLNYPDTFQGATNRENFTRDKYATFTFCSDGLEKTFTHAILGDVYTTRYWDNGVGSGVGNSLARNNGSYGFYLALPDGTTRVYSLVVDFVGKDNVPQVTWSDGTDNKVEYTYTDIGGCGSANYLSVIPPNKVNRDADLVLAGKNSFGDDIYALKNPDNFLLKDIYDNQYAVYQGEKISYEQFAKSRPAFFWYDPFGRLVKFQNNKFIPQAECGKPVIYLYPQTTTKVSVKLDPQGGFTASEPSYGTGWNVLAQPNGQLTEISTGKSYPYLFWEGRGAVYQQPKKGFVVSQNQVETFLREKLTALGLNQKEIADFIDFWLPRMQGAPYYFVTFLGNSAMNAIAPLSVNPKPDTVIRVLMDFSPLEKPVQVEGYQINTPLRKGFTVVEWGGVLRGNQ